MKNSTKRVVITGASSGIGAATAEAFALRGTKLVLAARNGDALEEVAARCRSAGSQVMTVPVDVTDAEAVASLAARAADWLGHIDVWFSNVGIGVVGRFHEVPIASHRQVLESNLMGHLNDAHAVLPIFLRQKHGVFINMISIGGFLPMPWAVAYTASKFGLRGMSEALRGEMSGYPRIHICDVYPTFVDTPAIRHAGNYTGGRTTLPPGALNPRTVAKAVVKLADHPRNSTGVGAPMVLLKAAQLLGPNVSAVAANGFMSGYFGQVDPAQKTDGNLFMPPYDDGEIDGGFRKPNQRRRTEVLVASLGIAAIATAGFFAARSHGRKRR